MFFLVYCSLLELFCTETKDGQLLNKPQTRYPVAARGFGLRPKTCRPSANTENSRRKREKPLVPRVQTRQLLKNPGGAFLQIQIFIDVNLTSIESTRVIKLNDNLWVLIKDVN